MNLTQKSGCAEELSSNSPPLDLEQPRLTVLTRLQNPGPDHLTSPPSLWPSDSAQTFQTHFYLRAFALVIRSAETLPLELQMALC